MHLQIHWLEPDELDANLLQFRPKHFSVSLCQEALIVFTDVNVTQECTFIKHKSIAVNIKGLAF